MSSLEEQIPDMYMRALKRYGEITQKKLNDPPMLKIKKVDDLLNAINQRNSEFSAFRNTRHNLFKVLNGALKPIELISNLAAGASSMPFPPATLVFAAANYLIGAAKGVSSSYDAIKDLMEMLQVRLFPHTLEKHHGHTVMPLDEARSSKIYLSLKPEQAGSRT